MSAVFELCKAVLTTGTAHQSFLDAKWVQWALRVAPAPLRRPLVLRLLALSPHYFYRQFRSDYAAMPTAQFLDCEYERNRASRLKISDELLRRFIQPGEVVLDLGCGPGFLAQAVAEYAATVYACDISRGVLACAQILHATPNLRFLHSSATGFAEIPDGSLDAVYSIAVIQHLTEAIIRDQLAVAATKLRPGGRCLWQVQLDAANWRPESEWRADRSLKGRLRLKYALNFFPRSEAFFREAAEAHGLTLSSVHRVNEFLAEPFDDIFHQHLIILTKSEQEPPTST